MRNDTDDINFAARPAAEGVMGEKVIKQTLGHVRLRDEETNQVILVPTPSSDPNDPLNWPQTFKYYVVGLTCTAMMICNFLAAGPSIALVETTIDFFPDGDLVQNFGKVAYFFTTTALLQGVGNFVWVPLANKYGRRPVYIASYLIYFAASLWLIFERSYTGFLVGRILVGFGSGAAETIAPLTITDVFFLHERCTVMSLYTAFLSVGVGFGVIISGLVTINHDWRVIYEVSTALIGVVLALLTFTLPETAYARISVDAGSVPGKSDVEARDVAGRPGEPTRALGSTTRRTWAQSLKVSRGSLTQESWLRMFLRPLGLIILPPVLWAALVQAVTIGFLVALSSNVAPAFSQTYPLETYQIGLCFIATIVGSLLGIPAGGHLGDKTADYFTRKNGGVRDPEMRLPAIALSLVSTPLALTLFGVGIHQRLHWICPTIGLGLVNFSITQATNICLVYVIDSYRPVAGEVTLAVMGFKSIFGFLLSFYTNPWVADAGYQNAYGTMAGIAAAVLVLWYPLFRWGKRVRNATWNWPIISYVHWTDDREVGE